MTLKIWLYTIENWSDEQAGRQVSEFNYWRNRMPMS